MSIFKKQNKLLEILAGQFIEYDKYGKGIPAVSFNDIYEKLDCNKESLHLISAMLFTENEVQLNGVSGIEGLCIDKNGITAFAQKQYLKVEIAGFLRTLKTGYR